MTIDQASLGVTPLRGRELDLGVRRVVPGDQEELWFPLLAEWLPRWLDVDAVPQMVGAPLRRGDQVRGHVIGCHLGERVRLRWRPRELEHDTELMVSLDPEEHGTELVVHLERLEGPAEQQAQREHWEQALEDLAREVEAERGAEDDMPT